MADFEKLPDDKQHIQTKVSCVQNAMSKKGRHPIYNIQVRKDKSNADKNDFAHPIEY